MDTLLWEPSRERAESTLIADFMGRLDIAGAAGNLDYDALLEYSIEYPGPFWRAVWDFSGVIGDPGQTDFVPAKDIRDIRFFPDASLNYAENLLRRRDGALAIIFHSECGERRCVTWEELNSLVGRLQRSMKEDGIGAGDRVAGVVANTPETVAAMIATASLGAVWSSCSPDFGINGVMDRFGQIEPKLLFCTAAYRYGGKTFHALPTAVEVANRIPSIGRVVVLPYAESVNAPVEGNTSFADYLGGQGPARPEFNRVGFRSPLFIMYSSGTTGLPKCIVHSVGGTVLQHLKEHKLQGDIKPGDRVMYATTCGWMMWNWLVSALASEATIVLYDGSPMHPDAVRLPDIASAEHLTHFGASAKYFDACAKAGLVPQTQCDLSALRVVYSTGSPLSPESFDYIYRQWKSDVCLSSIAGGTDILGCFVGASPISPVYRGQCQKRHLGMDIRVCDADGNSLLGEPGELVCASAHPSMPTGFFNDHDGTKYNDAYFSRYPGVWHHGDWVCLTETGGIVFFGRSDATLNPGGVRIGTAEIYRPVEQFDEVLEALAIGLNAGSDVEIVLFLRLRDGAALTDKLISDIKRAVRENASPRHVPSRIFAVSDIPRTKSGKIVELAVRNVVNGMPVKNIEALANPEALEEFKNLPGLGDQ